MMSREQLAWAAGFFDGEGHVSVRNGHRSLSFLVYQVDRRPLDKFKRAVGFGKVEGPYSNKGGGVHKHSKPIYRFALHNFEHVQAAVAMLWTWLSPAKRLQAKNTIKAIIRFHKTHINRPYNTRTARENR